jgi:hypothetical protein
LRLGYDCAFHSETTPVSAEITGTYSMTAAVGQPIQPTGTRIAVTLPHAAVADLTRVHSATATLTAGLGTVVTEGTKSSAADWQDFTSPATEIPKSGPMTLIASGAAPTVTPATAGKVTISAADLELVFTAPRGVSSPAESTQRSSRATPAGMQVACTPLAGDDATITQIVVAGSATSGQATRAAGKPKYCQPFIAHAKLNPLFPLPPPLPGSSRFYFPEKACAYSTGFTDAKKLNEAALIGPGLTDLVLGIPVFTKTIGRFGYFYQRGSGSFEYHGLPELPPAHATLLAFGFMPVSATIQLSEIGPLNIALISCGTGTGAQTKLCPHRPLLNRALVDGRVSLRISDVSINGVPLNVGPHCQTATPFDLKLTGVPPTYNIGLIHGVLTGTVTIPSFSGCANGTDSLDAVFDATVSGPGNFAKVTQAVPCFIANPTAATCPPRKPIPKH